MIRRLLWILLASLPAFCGCTAPSPPVNPETLSFPPLTFQVPAVDTMTLPGGIRLYLKEDHELPLVEITALVGAGDIDDPPGKTGQGGLFAALLRTGGAGKYDPEAFDAELERLAADLSVSTGTYATTCDLSLRSGDLQRGLNLLTGLLRRPHFDARRLELARQQAVEGVRRQNDQPSAIARRTLMEGLYGDHPLGRTPTVATLQAVSRRDLVAFHDRYFSPDNLWLAITGDFDRERLVSLLEQAFGDWSAGPAPNQEIPPLPESPSPVLRLADKDVPQTTVMFGEIGIDKDAPDLPAVRVMNWILGGGGFNSRLMREVRSNRGLAYSVYSYFQVGRRLPGPFVAGTETRSDSTLQVVRLMRDGMERIRRQPVSKAELALARESLINSFVFAFTDSHEIVSQQLRLDFYDYPADYLQRYRERIAAVTVDDVLQAARDHLHPGRQMLVLVGNEDDLGGDPSSLGLPVEPVSAGDR